MTTFLDVLPVDFKQTSDLLHSKIVEERERGVFIRINSQESPFVCVSAGGLAVLLLPSSFACVRA